MQKLRLLLILIVFPFLLNAQSKTSDEYASKPEHVDGQFSLGMRNTLSLFGHRDDYGLGYGAQFRIRVGKRLNTEWYSDYIKTDYEGLGHRQTAHIGWSVMFYPFNTSTRKGSFTPYIIAGHCFDYAYVSSNLYYDASIKDFRSESQDRWTSAVQLGLGGSYHFTDRFDMTLTAQYMSHLGNDIDSEVKELDDGTKYLFMDQGQQSLVLEGHLLVTMSLNYILFDFINPRP